MASGHQQNRIKAAIAVINNAGTHIPPSFFCYGSRRRYSFNQAAGRHLAAAIATAPQIRIVPPVPDVRRWEWFSATLPVQGNGIQFPGAALAENDRTTAIFPRESETSDEGNSIPWQPAHSDRHRRFYLAEADNNAAKRPQHQTGLTTKTGNVAELSALKPTARRRMLGIIVYYYSSSSPRCAMFSSNMAAGWIVATLEPNSRPFQTKKNPTRNANRYFSSHQIGIGSGHGHP